MGFMKYVSPSGRTGRPWRSLNHEGAPGAARTTRWEQELKEDAGVLAESNDIVSGKLARLLLRASTKYSVSGCFAICTDCFCLCTTLRQTTRERARSEFMAVLRVCMFCLTAKTPAISSAVLVLIEMAKNRESYSVCCSLIRGCKGGGGG